MPAQIIEANTTPFERVDVDPITLDLVENGLRNARYEMDAVLFRTAMSPGIREQHDEFPIIANRDGKMVVGQMGSFIHGFLSAYEGTIEDGDVFLMSDPYACNGAVSHLNDWLVMMPMYKNGRIISWSAMFGHMSDIGGKTPGSLPTDARQLFEEGLIIPPVKLYRKGEFQSDIMELVIMPFADGLSDFIKAMIQESIHQIRRWAEKGKVTIRLSARGTRGEQMGKWLEEDFGAEDIPKSFSLSVKLSPQLPKDDARAVNIFGQVMASGAMDEMSALAKVMADDDPVETIRRNKIKQAENSPGMLALDELGAFRKRLAEAEARASREGLSEEEQVARQVEVELLRGEIAIAENRIQAVQQQAASGGFPPEVLPPELTTENPDQRAAAEGRPNAATGGRPRLAGTK